MDYARIILELRRERARIDATIVIIEALASLSKTARPGGKGRPRGRPPKWLAEAEANPNAKVMRQKIVEYLASAGAGHAGGSVRTTPKATVAVGASKPSLVLGEGGSPGKPRTGA